MYSWIEWHAYICLRDNMTKQYNQYYIMLVMVNGQPNTRWCPLLLEGDIVDFRTNKNSIRDCLILGLAHSAVECVFRTMLVPWS